jgi:hypothetical protein
VGCKIVLRALPGDHKSPVAIEEAKDVVERYPCSVDCCNKLFPSKQGLTNHLHNHKPILALTAASVPLKYMSHA